MGRFLRWFARNEDHIGWGLFMGNLAVAGFHVVVGWLDLAVFHVVLAAAVWWVWHG